MRRSEGGCAGDGRAGCRRCCWPLPPGLSHAAALFAARAHRSSTASRKVKTHSRSYGVSGSYDGVTASASDKYKKSSSLTKDRTQSLLTGNASCTVYAYKLPPAIAFSKLKISSDFADAVSAVVSETDPDTIAEYLWMILQNWGTHYVNWVTLGGYALVSAQTKTQSITKEKTSSTSQSVSVGASMGNSFALSTGQASSSDKLTSLGDYNATV